MSPQRKLNRQRKKKPQNKTVSLEMDNKKSEIIIYLAFFLLVARLAMQVWRGGMWGGQCVQSPRSGFLLSVRLVFLMPCGAR